MEPPGSCRWPAEDDPLLPPSFLRSGRSLQTAFNEPGFSETAVGCVTLTGQYQPFTYAF